MPWKILDSGRNSPEQNMSLDDRLLKSMEYTDQPIVHLYDWEGDAATYGYFTNPADYLDLSKATCTLAKRPTGGGIIFHTEDLAFSVILPEGHPGCTKNTLQNYAYVNQRVASAIETFTAGKVKPALFEENEISRPSFCMIKPTVYDLVVEGKKVAGSAQRRTKWGLLHQGSICLKLTDAKHLQTLVSSDVKEAMQQNSYPLLTAGESLDASRRRLKRLIIEVFLKC